MCSLKRRRRQQQQRQRLEMKLLEWIDGWIEHAHIPDFILVLFVLFALKYINEYVLIIFFHHIQCFNKYAHAHTSPFGDFILVY